MAFWILQVGVTLEGSSLTKVDDDALPACWEENEPIQSVDDVKNKFKPLELTFGHGANQATMEIPPENYIVVTVSKPWTIDHCIDNLKRIGRSLYCLISYVYLFIAAKRESVPGHPQWDTDWSGSTEPNWRCEVQSNIPTLGNYMCRTLCPCIF